MYFFCVVLPVVAKNRPLSAEGLTTEDRSGGAVSSIKELCFCSENSPQTDREEQALLP